MDESEAIHKVQNLEEIVIQTCGRLHDQITSDVERKFLLKDEHYFQAEIYHGLIHPVNELDPNLAVKMEYRPNLLNTGHVDIAIIDQSKTVVKDILYINVIRRTKQTPGAITDNVLQMAALNSRAKSVVILITDERETADVYFPNNTVVDKKRQIIRNDSLKEILKVQDDFDYFIKRITNRLNLKENINQHLQTELLHTFSYGRLERDKFFIAVWKIEARNQRDGECHEFGGTFLTEVSQKSGRKDSYTLVNQLRASQEFKMGGQIMVYVISELVLRQNQVETERQRPERTTKDGHLFEQSPCD